MQSEIVIDGMEDEEFRNSIEALLREGDADAAARRVRALIAPHSGDGKPLPARFNQISARDLVVAGWPELTARLAALDKPGAPISAIGIDIADPGATGQVPDAKGHQRPYVETTYFTDRIFAFSQAGMNGLSKGYTRDGTAWAGQFDDIDDTVSIEGIDDLYGAVRRLELKAAGETGEEASPDEIQAGMLGAAYIAVLVHQAVRDAALEQGLPRPVALMVGSNDAYPFFEAPIRAARADGPVSTDEILKIDFDAPIAVGFEAALANGGGEAGGATDPGAFFAHEYTEDDFRDEEIEEDAASASVEDDAGFASLLMAAQREEDEEEEEEDEVLLHMPPPGIHTTGKQLRARFVTAESIAETSEAAGGAGLFARLTGAISARKR